MADGSMSEEWVEGNKIADEYDKSKDFTAMFWYEMSWSGSTGGYGHMNTFNTPGFESRTNANINLKNYYNTLKNHKDSISQFNHPGTLFGDFSGYAHYDEEIDELITLGCNLSGYTCSGPQSFVYSTSYWSSSSSTTGYVWVVGSNGSFNNGGYRFVRSFGVRPVITIQV